MSPPSGSSATPGRVEERVTRADIEAKLREIGGEVDEAGEQARNIGMIVGAVAIVVVVGVAFLLGRRRAKKTTTVVEIRRV